MMGLVRSQSVEIPKCGNNLLQVALLPLEFRDYTLNGHAERGFYHTQC
jgi:hypothetical protein